MGEIKHLTRRHFFALCEKHGFTKKLGNLYRCHGHGLLQVISYPVRNPIALQSPRNSEILFGVFSLYSKLNWIPSRILANVLQYDLPVTFEITPTIIPIDDNLHNLNKAQIILTAVIPWLDGLITHAQLADLLEKHDLICASNIVKNDTGKIVPYILSNQPEKAIECINAIEEQNWAAHQQNSQLIPGFDKECNSRIIENRLSPLISLRKAIYSKDDIAIAKHLCTNYRENVKQLKKLGVPVGDSCIVPNLLPPIHLQDN